MVKKPTTKLSCKIVTFISAVGVCRRGAALVSVPRRLAAAAHALHEGSVWRRVAGASRRGDGGPEPGAGAAASLRPHGAEAHGCRVAAVYTRRAGGSNNINQTLGNFPSLLRISNGQSS